MRSLFLIIATIFAITGCGDKEQSKEESSLKSVSSNNAPTIKVVEGATKIEDESPFVSYDLDGNRVIRFAPDGEETNLTKEIGALATIRNNYERINAQILAKRLSKNYILKCSSCHDDYANGVIGPSLLDKSAAQIFDKIKAYQDLTQVNILMKYLVSQMEDEEIQSLADEIANLNKEVMEAKNEQ